MDMTEHSLHGCIDGLPSLYAATVFFSFRIWEPNFLVASGEGGGARLAWAVSEKLVCWCIIVSLYHCGSVTVAVSCW